MASASSGLSCSVTYWLAGCFSTVLVRPIKDRQQRELQAGAQADEQDIGHCVGRICSGYWTGTGQIGGYGRDGEMEQEDTPHG